MVVARDVSGGSCCAGWACRVVCPGGVTEPEMVEGVRDWPRSSSVPSVPIRSVSPARVTLMALLPCRSTPYEREREREREREIIFAGKWG